MTIIVAPDLPFCDVGLDVPRRQVLGLIGARMLSLDANQRSRIQEGAWRTMWIQQDPVDAADFPLLVPFCRPGEMSLEQHGEIILLESYLAQRVPAG